MGIITLTSDMGLKDHYIPSVKGYILSRAPQTSVVDITHQVSPFNIPEASYIIKSCYRDFPEDAIHLISIDSHQESKRYLAVKTQHGIFFAHDNGILSLIFEEPLKEIISLPFEPSDMQFPMLRIMAPASVKLLSGASFDALGENIPSFLQLSNLMPIVDENIINGSVLHIDVFGNVITNIHKSVFEREARGRRYTIYATPRDRVRQLQTTYSDVEVSDLVCLFNSQGFLEIAINKANASSLLNIRKNANIMVEFE